jgi:hypothetical protein
MLPTSQLYGSLLMVDTVYSVLLHKLVMLTNSLFAMQYCLS